MDDIIFTNISSNISEHQDKINKFLSTLDSEKAYMVLSFERISESPLVIAVFDGHKIIGLTGLEKRLFFFCTYIILNKNYQGRGLGKKLTHALLKESQKFGHFIFSVMLMENIISFRQHISAGAKLVGTRKSTYYLFWPQSGIFGTILYWTVRLTFPLTKLYDSMFFIRKSLNNFFNNQ